MTRCLPSLTPCSSTVSAQDRRPEPRTGLAHHIFLLQTPARTWSLSLDYPPCTHTHTHMHEHTRARTRTHTEPLTHSLCTLSHLPHTPWHTHACQVPHDTHTQVHTNRPPLFPPLNTCTLRPLCTHSQSARRHHSQVATSARSHVPMHSHGPVHTGEHTHTPFTTCGHTGPLHPYLTSQASCSGRENEMRLGQRLGCKEDQSWLCLGSQWGPCRRGDLGQASRSQRGRHTH